MKNPINVLFPNNLTGDTSRRCWYLNTDSHKFDEYLDNKLNPSFPVDMTQKRTVRKRYVIVFFLLQMTTIWFAISL